MLLANIDQSLNFLEKISWQQDGPYFSRLETSIARSYLKCEIKPKNLGSVAIYTRIKNQEPFFFSSFFSSFESLHNSLN